MEMTASFTRALLSGFDRAYADLLRAATRSTGCREEAGDAVHDTWLRLAEHAQAAQAEQAGPADSSGAAPGPRDATAYLVVMAQNMALDAQRRRRRHGRYLDAEAVREQMAPSHAPDVAESVMYRQALAALEAALVALPERSRKAFVAHRVHGVRQPEIAARLGVSLNTVERDLIQANACIEDVLHRWRGSSPAGAQRAGHGGGAAAWAPCWDWRAWGWAGLPPGSSGCCIARPMCSGRPAGAAHAASRCATACPTARTCCWMRPAVPGCSTSWRGARSRSSRGRPSSRWLATSGLSRSMPRACG
jgi:RNA polymerase sigma factor (sigma-70 family)